MRVKISRWGNSLGVRLPRAVVDEVGLNEGQTVDVSARDGAIELKPTLRVPRYRLEDLLAEAERLGPENRPPFEDWGILRSEWPDDDWTGIAPSDEEMGKKKDAGQRRAARKRR